MTPETIARFRIVLTEITGYYYTNDRVEFLLAKISGEATDLTHYLDGLSNKTGKLVNKMNLRQKLKQT